MTRKRPIPKSFHPTESNSERPPVALVVGHVTLDHGAAGLIPGGSAYYAAGALAALGAEVRVLTAAGPDYPVRALADLGRVDARVLASPRTTTFENHYDATGMRTQRVHSAAPPILPADLPEAWREPDLLLLAPVLGELEPAPFVALARARATGLCVQGLVRELRPGGAVVPRRLEPDARSLAGIALAVLGQDEAAGEPGLPEALASVVRVVAFTHGAGGADVLAGGRTWHIGIHPAREIDPTGAGDVFAAAMLLALSRGAPPPAAARLGAAAASIVVEGRGGETLARVGEAALRTALVPVREK